MFDDDPPDGAWTVLAQNPTIAGPVIQGDVLEFDLVWLDREGRQLRVDRLKLPEESVMPLSILKAALHLKTQEIRSSLGG